MPNYGDPNYWNERYAQCDGSMFDWLEDFSSLKGLLDQFIKPHFKILVIGCGNANFSEDLYDAGYHHVWNIDISQVVIEQMKKRNQKREGMHYEIMDACNLKYPDNFFDVAIDKSTIDAILCGDNAFLNTAIMLKEAQRVLREDGGTYIAISYGKPSTRSLHFQRPFLSWSLKEFILSPVDAQNEEDKEEKSHYIYVCTKQHDWQKVYQENFEPVILQLILHEKNMANNKEEDDDDEESQDLNDSKPMDSRFFSKEQSELGSRPNSA
jgi:ubiquinone/menaquinone biosynthesis C-methylase UbiE